MKKNLDTELDDRWRNKGHTHAKHSGEPKPCPYCQGYGYNEAIDGTPITCEYCEGEGVIYD